MKSCRKQCVQVLLLVLLVPIAGSCNAGQKIKGPKGDLIYIPVTQKSEFLSAHLDLSANIKSQEMLAVLKLTNTGSKPMTITEVTINTEGGLQSFPTTGNIKPIILPAGRDTLMTTRFRPVNDVKVYQLTGKNGRFKLNYKVSVFYKQQGDDKMFSADLNVQLPPDDYTAYTKTYATPFIGYSFNTASNFDQTERDYLGTLKLKDPAFAFVAQHEIAVTGLNIWMTSYCENDTLYAQFLIVNHDAYAVKIIPDSLDFACKSDGTKGNSKTIILEKITGSQQNKEVIEKDGKLLIHFKKRFTSSDRQVIISLKHAFILDGSRALFNNNIELVKVRLL